MVSKSVKNNYKGHVIKIALGFFILALLFAYSASAATLTVNTSGGAMYTKIQDAIDDASAGDTILVDSGTYFENVNVTKRLFLRGGDNGGAKPILDAYGTGGNVIILSADGITLEEFTIRGGGLYQVAGITIGIKVTSSNNSLINNSVTNNDYGIYLDSSSSNNLSGNTVSNNVKGIQLSSSSNNNVSGNAANFNSEGIRMNSASTHNLLTGNTANYNIDTGIRLIDSSDNTLEDNSASNNINSGIELDGGCTNNILSSNNASNNSNGIRLSFSNNNNNILSNNTANSNLYTGIVLGAGSYGGSTNNILSGNIVLYNSIGISLASSSINNKIYDNLLNNIKNVQVDANNIWNLTKTAGINIIGGPYLGGNIWTNPSGTGFSQTCTDVNSDGICDSPYTLDSNNIDYLPLKSPQTDIVSQYAGPDGIVQRDEALNAVADYFNDLITKEGALKVVAAYFNS